MVPKQPDPPTHHHPELTKKLSPLETQSRLSKFLERTLEYPHLHPDSHLSKHGIEFPGTSGPRGGLALHHLRRIEAGLRGENLIAESQEELDAQFGDLPAGDDDALNRLIEGTEKQRRKDKKRKRKEISEWAEETSSQADFDGGRMPREIESFAATPLHESDYQNMESYELSQRPLEGEVGEREPAQVVQQGGQVPEVVEHDEDGAVVDSHTKEKTEAEKAARRAAKKARRKAEKQKKIKMAKENG